jgi:hypothetical protein
MLHGVLKNRTHCSQQYIVNIGTIYGWKCSFDVIHRMASYSMLPTNLGLKTIFVYYVEGLFMHAHLALEFM